MRCRRLCAKGLKLSQQTTGPTWQHYIPKAQDGLPRHARDARHQDQHGHPPPRLPSGSHLQPVRSGIEYKAI